MGCFFGHGFKPTYFRYADAFNQDLSAMILLLQTYPFCHVSTSLHRRKEYKLTKDLLSYYYYSKLVYRRYNRLGGNFVTVIVALRLKTV